MTKELLDLKDRKILYILAQEARTPPSIIAKQVGLSKDAVKYRIRRLEQKKIIYNYITEIDTSPLGYVGYDLFLKFNIPPEEEHKISDYFDSHPNIIWSCFISGEWTYFAEIMCDSGDEFHSITTDLAARFADQLEDYELYMVGTTYRVTQIVESVYDGEDINLKDIVEPTQFLAGNQKITLDSTEKKILSVMSEQATLPIHRIASLAGTTPEVVRYRLRKLKKERIIIRNTPVIDYDRLGFDEYIVLIRMKSLTPEKEDKLRMRVQHMKSIKYAYRALGKQIMFGLFTVKDLDELEHLMKQLRTEFFGTIHTISYFHITEHKRFTLFPEVLQK